MRYDTHSYCQRWQLHLTLSRLLYRGHGNGGVLGPITGSVYIVWFYRLLGAKIGKNVSVWAGGRPGLMTEPDLVTLGDNVSLDDCSVVAHINSRGKFALNKLVVGEGCALRTGSRLLSGAHMEERSMLLEHALLASGDIAESGAVYAGWPARQQDRRRRGSDDTVVGDGDEDMQPISKTVSRYSVRYSGAPIEKRMSRYSGMQPLEKKTSRYSTIQSEKRMSRYSGMQPLEKTTSRYSNMQPLEKKTSRYSTMQPLEKKTSRYSAVYRG